MPNWANLMLTKQGKVLQAKAIAGSTLTITKMKLGSGIIPDGVSPEDLTDLIQPKQALGLTAISVNGGLAKIQSIVTNAELSEGYYIRECGVFANDPDVGEIMYAIMTDTSPDFLPSASSSVVISEEFSINVVTENMANITAIIDPEGIVTVANARKIAEDKVAEHNEAPDAHPNDFNLKGLTIGKDNVIATKKGDFLTLLAGKGINLLSDIKNKIITVVGKSKNAWNPNEEIIAGDIRYTEDGNGPSWAYLLCKTAGTTGTVEPILAANAVVGQEINDGSVVWTVQKNSNALSFAGKEADLFALLNSPDFKGTPTAPTAAKTVNNTQIATTAFVHLLAGAANNGGIVDSLLAQNGYVKFANGLILQWGYAALTSQNKSVSTNITMPNNNYIVQLTSDFTVTSDGYGALACVSRSTTNFIVTKDFGETNKHAFWLIIG